NTCDLFAHQKFNLKFMALELKDDHEVEAEWRPWIKDLIAENIFQRESTLFYHHNQFEHVKAIENKNAYIATLKGLKKTVFLKPIYMTSDFTIRDMINNIKKHKKLEIHDGILEFYGITMQENTKIPLQVFEYANGGTLCEYLTMKSKKLSWNIKLYLAKQIAGVLMCLHLNGIAHGRLSAKSILVHNGIIKLSDFERSAQICEPFNILPKTFDSNRNMEPHFSEILKIIGCKRSSDIYNLGIVFLEISISPLGIEKLMECSFSDLNGKEIKKRFTSMIPRKYAKICADCWNHDENRRPNIVQIFNELDGVDFSDMLNELEIPILRYNIEDIEYNEIIKINTTRIDPPTEKDKLIMDLFHFFSDTYEKQHKYISPILVRKYVSDLPQNPTKMLYLLISHRHRTHFTSMIGFFHEHGIGTIVDYQIAFEYYSKAANVITDGKERAVGARYLRGNGIEKDVVEGI
ncbi:11174_t:CDS:2, partial [Acaulospora morrowiae]